ncbi:MAG: hypothetical protein ACR2OM_07070, partial [Aestuariivirgaceae bacterium]
MVSSSLTFQPIGKASFGVVAGFAGGAASVIDRFAAAGDEVRAQLAEAGGLMVIKGLTALADAPDQLVRLSRVFGPEVEHYRE